jgi:hypothetical protein
VSSPRAHAAFSCLFAVAAAAGILAGSVGQVALDNVSCRSSGYGGGAFLAYCQSTSYGSYEHGALYHGVEPGVSASLRKAQVVFLGSSRAQVAFSSTAVRRYFRSRDIRFFLMGFGHGEQSQFAQALIAKWRLSPKVLVINTDPFFIEKLSPPAREAIDGGPAYLWRLALKMLFQRVHRAACAIPWSPCPESDGSIFRSAEDGQWSWIRSYAADRTVPVDRATQQKPTPEALARTRDLGERFLADVGIDRRCVVLTGTPNSSLDATSVAESLAPALGTRSISPPMDGLATLDGEHLNPASAERWSALLVEALTPILAECLAR